MKNIYNILLILLFLSFNVFSQELALPVTVNKSWTIKNPKEVCTYFLFDPSLVSTALPEYLTFVSVGTLAKRGVEWAVSYLDTNKNDSDLCVSFIEILQADTFRIAEKSIDLSTKAIGVWFARVEAKREIRSYGNTLLSLKLFVPDSGFAHYMSRNGYFAEYADVNLIKINDLLYNGQIKSSDLFVDVKFSVSENLISNNSYGTQSIYLPKGHNNKMIVVNFKGHKIFNCENINWIIKGSDISSRSKIIGETTFQKDYDLIGGVCSIE
jgi:hypothetical protein